MLERVLTWIDQLFCRHKFIIQFVDRTGPIMSRTAYTHVPGYLECIKCGKVTPGLRTEKKNVVP